MVRIDHRTGEIPVARDLIRDSVLDSHSDDTRSTRIEEGFWGGACITVLTSRIQVFNLIYNYTCHYLWNGTRWYTWYARPIAAEAKLGLWKFFLLCNPQLCCFLSPMNRLARAGQFYRLIYIFDKRAWLALRTNFDCEFCIEFKLLDSESKEMRLKFEGNGDYAHWHSRRIWVMLATVTRELSTETDKTS